MVFALIDSLVVFGASIPRILCEYFLLALLGMSTFGTIIPLVPIALMIWYPRNVNPSVIWVTFVFSSESVSPMVQRSSFSSSFMAWASALVPLQSTTKSRVKEWLSDRRPGLAVAAGF